jgi:hypothetical protein
MSNEQLIDKIMKIIFDEITGDWQRIKFLNELSKEAEEKAEFLLDNLSDEDKQ